MSINRRPCNATRGSDGRAHINAALRLDAVLEAVAPHRADSTMRHATHEVCALQPETCGCPNGFEISGAARVEQEGGVLHVRQATLDARFQIDQSKGKRIWGGDLFLAISQRKVVAM
eukprot:1407941-Pleurochrysis_carterae.AAC.2